MFNFLTSKEKGVLFIFPLLMIAVIIFLGVEVNYFRNAAAVEKERKQQWQARYLSLNEQMAKFSEKQTALLQAVDALRTQNQQQKQEIKNALHKNQDWSNSPVPDDVKRLLNQSSTAH